MEPRQIPGLVEADGQVTRSEVPKTAPLVPPSFFARVKGRLAAMAAHWSGKGR